MTEIAEYIGTGRLLSESAFEALKRNGRMRKANAQAGVDADMAFRPVVKLFTPDATRTWLLVAISPDNSDEAFGLIDSDDSAPAMTTVSLTDLLAFRGPKGLRIERDIYFTAEMTIGDYAELARENGRILT